MRLRLTAAGLTAAVVLAGCTSGGEADGPRPAPSGGAIAEEYAAAVSAPVEDSVYPAAGDPGVDALHYDLELTWDKDARVLSGEQQLVFRATATAPAFRLDLSEQLATTGVTLDGEPVAVRREGKDLVVDAPVRADAVHTLALDYAGTPQPVPAPSRRGDTEPLGLTVDSRGGLWTMQEPYGAYTWYAVNDQPSDKALYDITVHAPGDWVGVANGVLESRETADGRTTTHWRLDDPAAAYLVTLAVGAYTLTEATGPRGLPITYWVPADDPGLVNDLERTPELLAWLEERLGPYPFDALGIVVVESESGMETQSMITLGDDGLSTAPEVIVHELAHQWYGDLVTPADWRDVWMNEGMATYLQGVWQDEAWQLPPGESIAEWARLEPRERREAGPPGAYDPGRFADQNVYFGPAVMWHRLRSRVGEEAFWRLVREWPAARAGRSTTREDYVAWVNEQLGEDLTPFFTAWLTSPTTPR